MNLLLGLIILILIIWAVVNLVEGGLTLVGVGSPVVGALIVLLVILLLSR